MKHKLILLAFLYVLLLSVSVAYADEIYLDQVGYFPEDQKIVVVEGAAKEYSIVDEAEQETTSLCQGTSFYDQDTGKNVSWLDLSYLTTPGEYVLTFGEAEKYIIIGKNPYRKLFETAMRTFYLQRCGIEIDDFNTGLKHGVCHFNDGVFYKTTKKRGIADCRGGWHDAGDYGKYSPPANYAASNLLLFYSLNKYKAEDVELDIPKLSLLPDILDEIKYELDWLLTMQDPATGGVYHKLTPKDFARVVMPDKDLYERYIFRVSSNATAGFAGVMAQAYQVYKGYDPDYAARLLKAAAKAWSFLEANPRVVPPGGYNNPPGVKTGVYGDPKDLGERLFAAVELYQATDEQQYLDYFENNYRRYNLKVTPYVGWRDLGHQAYIAYLLLPPSKGKVATRKKLLLELTQLADKLVDRARENGFRVGLKPSDYVWGSNGVVLDYAKVLIYAYELTRDEKYLDVARDHLHYVLGQNGLDKCFVTGFGENPVRHLHNRPSMASGIDFPGFLAGGPNKYFQSTKIRTALPGETPPALVYLDSDDCYSTNENSIYWNASLVFVAGYFSN